LLKRIVNKIRKLPVPAHKKQKSRRVFGFWCDQGLALHVKTLAGIIGVPVYALAEHLLQLGLAHIGHDLSAGDSSCAGDGDPLNELHDHVLHQHLLVDKLGEEEYEERLIAKHAELTPEQEEQVNAVINLVKKFEDEGIPYGLVIEIVQELAARLRTQRKMERLQREFDFQVLREINQRFPRLIPALQKLMAKYSWEDLAPALSRFTR